MPEEATPFFRDPARKIPFPVLGETRVFTTQTGLFIRKMFEELMPLPPENTESYAHGSGYVFQREDSSIGDGAFEPHLSQGSIDYESIVSINLQAFISSIEGMAQSLAREMINKMYQVVAEASGSVGNTVSARESGSLAQGFLDMIKRIEFGVNRRGEVTRPEIHSNPQVISRLQAELSAQGPEYRQELEAIIRQKNKEALEKEKERLAKFKRA
jgi:hypothetical protein